MNPFDFSQSIKKIAVQMGNMRLKCDDQINENDARRIQNYEYDDAVDLDGVMLSTFRFRIETEIVLSLE